MTKRTCPVSPKTSIEMVSEFQQLGPKKCQSRLQAENRRATKQLATRAVVNPTPILWPVPPPPPMSNICRLFWDQAMILTAAAAAAQYDYNQCVNGQVPV